MTAPARTAPAAVPAPAQRPKSFDPFRILTPAERRQQLDACLRVLEERDGEIDFAVRTLSRREALFRELAKRPVMLEDGIDREAFFQHLHRRGRPPLDPRTLWVLAVTRTNEGESYGARGEIERYERVGLDGADPHEIYILLEEQYHSRLLVEACRTLGIDLAFEPPARAMRLLIHAMQHLPARARYVIILCAEVLSCTVFRWLLEKCDVFPDRADVERRLRLLLDEVVTDEVFHVIYCRARIGPIAMRAARLALPVVALGLVSGVPQLRQLGLTPRRILERVRREIAFPDGVDWGLPEPVGA